MNKKEYFALLTKPFVKSGITVVSALAGEGKTTYMLNFKQRLEDNGYRVFYFDADYSGMNDDMYEVLPHEEMIEWLKDAEEHEVVIIDSLKAYCGVSNIEILDNYQVIRMMLDFRMIITSTKCSIILIHHSFKEKKLKNAPEHLFGARALEEQADSAFLFKRDGKKCKIVKCRIPSMARDTLVDLS